MNYTKATTFTTVRAIDNLPPPLEPATITPHTLPDSRHGYLSGHWIAAHPWLVHKGDWQQGIATGIGGSHGWNSAIECRSRVQSQSLLLLPLSPYPVGAVEYSKLHKLHQLTKAHRQHTVSLLPLTIHHLPLVLHYWIALVSPNGDIFINWQNWLLYCKSLGHRPHLMVWLDCNSVHSEESLYILALKINFVTWQRCGRGAICIGAGVHRNCSLCTPGVGWRALRKSLL